MEFIECSRCQNRSNATHKCVHCIRNYCFSCLSAHHHYEVKHEIMNNIQLIDGILQSFLHHAHNQIEWTTHLAKDRSRLNEYLQVIKKSPESQPMILTPSHEWLKHVNQLILKRRYHIFANCSKKNVATSGSKRLRTLSS